MTISTLSPNTPADDELVSAYPAEVRNNRNALIDSFPGFVATDDILSSGAAAVDNAANKIDGVETTADAAAALAGDNANRISTLEGKTDDFTALFHGRVEGDGTLIRLPAGWTSAPAGTGFVTITHNLGAVLTVTATALDPDQFLRSVKLSANDINSFTINTRSSSGNTNPQELHFTAVQ